MVGRYTNSLILSEKEVIALDEMMDDIAEYVTDEMFSSHHGLGAFRRIREKTKKLKSDIDKRNEGR